MVNSGVNDDWWSTMANLWAITIVSDDSWLTKFSDGWGHWQFRPRKGLRIVKQGTRVPSVRLDGLHTRPNRQVLSTIECIITPSGEVQERTYPDFLIFCPSGNCFHLDRFESPMNSVPSSYQAESRHRCQQWRRTAVSCEAVLQAESGTVVFAAWKSANQAIQPIQLAKQHGSDIGQGIWWHWAKQLAIEIYRFKLVYSALVAVTLLLTAWYQKPATHRASLRLELSKAGTWYTAPVAPVTRNFIDPWW